MIVMYVAPGHHSAAMLEAALIDVHSGDSALLPAVSFPKCAVLRFGLKPYNENLFGHWEYDPNHS